MEELNHTDYQALAEFRYQIRRFLHFSEEQARAQGIEPQQHQLLLAIKGLPAGRKPAIRELAERLQLKHHSVVELVDRLEVRGAVRRAQNESDRREVLILLTSAGDAILQQLSILHHEQLETAGPLLAKALRRVMQGSKRAGRSAA